MNVKVRCPKCGAVTYKESLESLIREVESLWKPWQEYLTVEQKKMLRESHRLESLEKILEENGEIKMFCPVCIFNLTIELRRQQDLSLLPLRKDEALGI